MTPDWSAKVEPVPYAKLGDPQSLNLYAYVMNNPVTNLDAYGHQCGTEGTGPSGCATPPPAKHPKMANRQARAHRDSLAWTFSWQVSASSKFLVGELEGVADTTVTPVIQTVEHPIKAAESVAHAVAHPIETAKKIATGAVDTARAVANGNPRAIGQVAGLAISVYVAVRGVQGAEIKINDDLRIAPAGNRTGGIGELPHYHRRIVGPDGKTVPGGGIGWHRPWEP